MSGSVPQPAEPGAASPVDPVAPIDRTGGYLGATGAAAVAAASRSTPARWRLLLRKTTFWVGAIIVLFWVVCAIFGHLFAPYDPLAQDLLANNQAPSGAHWFGTDQLGRDVLSRVIVGARYILIITPLATLLGTVLGTALGLAMGYFGGWFDSVVSRIVEAILALPFVIIVFALRRRRRPVRGVDHRHHRPRLHAADRADGPDGGAGRATSGLRVRVPAARREPGPGHVRRDPAQRPARHRGRVHGPARLRGLRAGHAVLPRLRHQAAHARTGARTSRPTTAACWPATGGRRCSRRSPSPRW